MSEIDKSQSWMNPPPNKRPKTISELQKEIHTNLMGGKNITFLYEGPESLDEVCDILFMPLPMDSVDDIEIMYSKLIAELEEAGLESSHLQKKRSKSGFKNSQELMDVLLGEGEGCDNIENGMDSKDVIEKEGADPKLNTTSTSQEDEIVYLDLPCDSNSSEDLSPTEILPINQEPEEVKETEKLAKDNETKDKNKSSETIRLLDSRKISVTVVPSDEKVDKQGKSEAASAPAQQKQQIPTPFTITVEPKELSDLSLFEEILLKPQAEPGPKKSENQKTEEEKTGDIIQIEDLIGIDELESNTFALSQEDFQVYLHDEDSESASDKTMQSSEVQKICCDKTLVEETSKIGKVDSEEEKNQTKTDKEWLKKFNCPSVRLNLVRCDSSSKGSKILNQENNNDDIERLAVEDRISASMNETIADEADNQEEQIETIMTLNNEAAHVPDQENHTYFQTDPGNNVKEDEMIIEMVKAVKPTKAKDDSKKETVSSVKPEETKDNEGIIEPANSDICVIVEIVETNPTEDKKNETPLAVPSVPPNDLKDDKLVEDDKLLEVDKIAKDAEDEKKNESIPVVEPILVELIDDVTPDTASKPEPIVEEEEGELMMMSVSRKAPCPRSKKFVEKKMVRVVEIDLTTEDESDSDSYVTIGPSTDDKVIKPNPQVASSSAASACLPIIKSSKKHPISNPKSEETEDTNLTDSNPPIQMKRGRGRPARLKIPSEKAQSLVIDAPKVKMVTPPKQAKQRLLPASDEKCIDFMEAECEKRNPDLELLIRLMNKTRDFRKIFLPKIEFDVGKGLKKFPALRDYRVMKHEMNRLTEKRGKKSKEEKLELLEEKLASEMENAIQLKKRPGEDRHELWLQAIEWAKGERSSEERKILGMICLCFHLAEDEACGKVFRIRKENERPKFREMGFPTLDILESEIFSVNAQDMWVYAEGMQACKVPNFYEGVLTCYAMHYVFDMEYLDHIKQFYEHFDTLCGFK